VLPIVPSAQRDFARSDRATALFYLYQNAGRPLAPANLEVRITDATGAVLVRDPRVIPVAAFVAAQAEASVPPRSITGGAKPTPGVAATAARQTSSPIRAAEIQYPLPLDRLPSGRHLLTFEVTIGETTLRRDVQFSVR
jgi:hypothetical protein